jgi:hypothetical protein
VNYQQWFHVEPLLILDPINWGPAFRPEITWQNLVSLTCCRHRDPFAVISFAFASILGLLKCHRRPSSCHLLRRPGTASTRVAISGHCPPSAFPPQALHQCPTPLCRPLSTVITAINLLSGHATVGSPCRWASVSSDPPPALLGCSSAKTWIPSSVCCGRKLLEQCLVHVDHLDCSP